MKMPVVCLCALSSAGVNAAWRAAFVARDLGAPLRILHAASPARMLARAETSLAELAEDIGQRTCVHPVLERVGGNVLRHLVAASRDAALVVLPDVRGRVLSDWILGTAVERLVGPCHAPVLVVRRPALASYRRVLVPVDLGTHAVPLIRLASALTRGPRADLLHVVDIDDENLLRESDASLPALNGYREHRARGAILRMHQLIGLAQPDGAPAEPSIAFGDARRTVLECASVPDLELVAVGKRRRGLPAAWVLGPLTRRLLARTSADVLVHPARAPQDFGFAAASSGLRALR